MSGCSKTAPLGGEPGLGLGHAHARGHEHAAHAVDVVGLRGVDALPDVPGLRDEVAPVAPGDGELDGVAGVPEVRGHGEAAAEHHAAVAPRGVAVGGLLDGELDGGEGGRVVRGDALRARGAGRRRRRRREGAGDEDGEVGAHETL